MCPNKGVSFKLEAILEGTTEVQILEVEEDTKEEKEMIKDGIDKEEKEGEGEKMVGLKEIQGDETLICLNRLAKVVYSWYSDKKSDELNDIL